jgi:hypothetical protein
VFENRMLRQILAPKRVEVTGGHKKIAVKGSQSSGETLSVLYTKCIKLKHNVDSVSVCVFHKYFMDHHEIWYWRIYTKRFGVNFSFVPLCRKFR